MGDYSGTPSWQGHNGLFAGRIERFVDGPVGIAAAVLAGTPGAPRTAA
jgi:hypothetical protein